MSFSLGSVFNFFLRIEKQERLKVLLLTFSYLFVIGGYTIVKELKDSIFTSVVGDEYVGTAKIVSMIILIPAILFYSKLVDLLRRHQLLYFYSIFYGLLGLIFTYFLGHPTIGLANTEPSKYRLMGWLFYFFIEGYSPFVVSVFWAFANSVSTPESAKNNYSLMIAGSKIGGMISAAFAWFLLTKRSNFCGLSLSDVTGHQILLAYASICLFMITFAVYLLTHKVSSRNLHGYEAAYQAAKQEEKNPEAHTGFKSLFAGLVLLIRQPYLLGIFATIFFYEIINVVLQLKRLSIFKGSSECISDLSAALFSQIFLVHIIGLLVAVFGKRSLMKLFGERRCLILAPIVISILIGFFLVYGTTQVVLVSLVLLRAVNYAFMVPLRESLYIPTVKEMKFKSKSWIEAFGGKFSKSVGGIYKDLTYNFAGSVAFVDTFFFGTLMVLWLIVAYFLGAKYERAIKNNEVIGAEKES